MAAGAILVLLHRGVAMASLRWEWFETFLSGRSRELVVEGAQDPTEMRKGLITKRDLDEAVRKKTGHEATPIKRAVLEREGTSRSMLAQ